MKQGRRVGRWIGGLNLLRKVNRPWKCFLEQLSFDVLPSYPAPQLEPASQCQAITLCRFLCKAKLRFMHFKLLHRFLWLILLGWDTVFYGCNTINHCRNHQKDMKDDLPLSSCNHKLEVLGRSVRQIHVVA